MTLMIQSEHQLICHKETVKYSKGNEDFGYNSIVEGFVLFVLSTPMTGLNG